MIFLHKISARKNFISMQSTVKIVDPSPQNHKIWTILERIED